jgi:alkanesulfonate monooxygenase SsuD/methylene tetrahydromethanopterin reductase-like flavin-dependent oxidoreductase (luciferase family)
LALTSAKSGPTTMAPRQTRNALGALLSGFLVGISRGRSPAVLADITTAESHGVDAVWSGGGGAMADTLTIYAAAALQTSTVTLGTSIIPTYLRHPVVMASEALAIEGWLSEG